jgi:hypothetical protein
MYEEALFDRSRHMSFGIINSDFRVVDEFVCEIVVLLGLDGVSTNSTE